MAPQSDTLLRPNGEERLAKAGNPVADPQVEEILEFLRSEQDAYYHSDFEAFIDHWHQGPETMRMVSGPVVGTRIHRGWDELLPRFREGFRQYPQDFDNRSIIRNENVQVMISGDMAWVRYDQVAVDRPDGMHLPTLSHGLKIVRRINGAWKLVCLVDVAPGAGRTDAPQIELAADGRVIAMNELAQARLPTHPGLIVSGERLRARQRSHADILKAAIATRMRDLSTNLPTGYLSEPATVVPLGEDAAGNALFCWVGAGRERIIVTFDDEVLLREKLLVAAETFALTPAQVDIAERLATGYDLAGTADDLAISVNTVRTQVRRMFEKTGVHTQVALVSLLLSLQRPDNVAF